MQDIAEYLKRSIEDNFISKEEKKVLRDIIGNRILQAEERQVLIQTIFQLAGEHTKDSTAQFVLDWVRQTIAVINQADGGSSEAFFSPGESCREAIIDQIGKAKDKIRIAVFTISDDAIVNAILGAHKRGKQIRILTDNDKSLDLGSDITRLSKAGVSVRMDNSPAHMHHKFMVTDDATLLTGSYNWTQSAARVNYENVIVTQDDKLVKSFAKEFERLWVANTF